MCTKFVGKFACNDRLMSTRWRQQFSMQICVQLLKKVKERQRNEKQYQYLNEKTKESDKLVNYKIIENVKMIHKE